MQRGHVFMYQNRFIAQFMFKTIKRPIDSASLPGVFVKGSVHIVHRLVIRRRYVSRNACQCVIEWDRRGKMRGVTRKTSFEKGLTVAHLYTVMLLKTYWSDDGKYFLYSHPRNKRVIIYITISRRREKVEGYGRIWSHCVCMQEGKCALLLDLNGLRSRTVGTDSLRASFPAQHAAQLHQASCKPNS